MAYIVSISGPPGEGKTSLAMSLEARLGSAATILFDTYEQLTDQPLDEIIRWMDQGADIDQFVIPDLAEALTTLKQGDPIVDPISGQTIGPASTILFETPFGRQHTHSGQHIDLSLWIDIPLDVALARKIKQMTASSVPSEHPEQTHQGILWLQDYLDNYMTGTQALLRMQRDKVRKTADATIKGMAPLDDMTDQAEREILKRR